MSRVTIGSQLLFNRYVLDFGSLHVDGEVVLSSRKKDGSLVGMQDGRSSNGKEFRAAKSLD